MAWLSDWAKRIELTIADTNVDSDLTNFPVLIYISAASGIGDVDASAVFDELTSDANRKKIAVTSDDGETQLYVEIERWDDANEEAWLWVKVPSILASGGATLYLYYDSTQSDNSTYVGDTGDAAAQSVWDANFVGVWHMAQDPNGDPADAIKDSTSNGYDGTPSGSMTSADLVDGLVGKGIDFDGSNDSINFGDIAEIDNASALTYEIIMYHRAGGSNYGGYLSKELDNAGSYKGLSLRASSDSADIEAHGLGANDNVAAVLNINDWNYVAAGWDGDNLEIYLDGVSKEGPLNVSDNPDAETQNLYAGRLSYAAIFQNPILCEIRVSNIRRSVEWVKATHYSNTDAIITLGSEETYPGGDINVSLTEAFTITCSLSATLAIGIPLSSSFEVQTSLSITGFGAVIFPDPFNVDVSMSIGDIVCIFRELLNRDSQITTILSENSPITKTLSRDSLISDLTENSILGT